MALRSHKTQELKDWLETNKFGQFFEKICESGVETLDDLRELQTESDVMELAGPNGINMGVVFRRKFVRAVLTLSQSKSAETSAPTQEAPVSQPTPTANNKAKPEATTNTVKVPESEPASVSSPKESKGKGLTSAEQQALNELVSTIKDHTQQLRTSRDDLTNVKKQAEDSRKELTELFDKAMGALVVRKKHLENALNLAEVETTQSLKQRVVDLQSSAKNLLKSKQSIEEQIKSAPGGPDRQQYVSNSVETSLKDCPPKEKGRISIVFDQGDTPLIEFLERYGSVGVGRQKESSNQET